MSENGGKTFFFSFSYAVVKLGHNNTYKNRRKLVGNVDDKMPYRSVA